MTFGGYKHAALTGLKKGRDICCYKHTEETPKQINPTGLKTHLGLYGGSPKIRCGSMKINFLIR